MAVLTRGQLKELFENGDLLAASTYVHLIDSISLRNESASLTGVSPGADQAAIRLVGSVAAPDQSGGIDFKTNAGQLTGLIRSGQSGMLVGNVGTIALVSLDETGGSAAGYRQQYLDGELLCSFYGAPMVPQSTGWHLGSFTPTKVLDIESSTFEDLLNFIQSVADRLLDLGQIAN